jgi:hypothetical protein
MRNARTGPLVNLKLTKHLQKLIFQHKLMYNGIQLNASKKIKSFNQAFPVVGLLLEVSL